MNEDINTKIENNNKFIYKTNAVKDVNGNIVEPATYLDSQTQTNIFSQQQDLTKEQLEEMKKKIQAGIDKTADSLSVEDLANFYIYNSSDEVRTSALKEIKNRIENGTLNSPSTDWSKEDFYSRVASSLEQERRNYLQSVARDKSVDGKLR